MKINPFKTTAVNKFKEGDTVYAKECPKIALIIRRYVNRIYYCKIVDDLEGNELVYYERELIETLKKV